MNGSRGFPPENTQEVLREFWILLKFVEKYKVTVLLELLTVLFIVSIALSWKNWFMAPSPTPILHFHWPPTDCVIGVWELCLNNFMNDDGVKELSIIPAF